ncbi:hypothetical protein R2223_004467 [Cronobacter sakazakii]|nr:hypothetical protein [Cronobacter sakazakii]ELQ6044308.1 hypothetical protein [Cronobacter sakazakii]ELQ6086729.1 hypothetical protein [Cronobacter sakazakii]ELQ6091280.1 hypothetical protein [Cronobacter sakazakii]ELQ6201983.1 hypothetical protein [Cronobacter sakazakii]
MIGKFRINNEVLNDNAYFFHSNEKNLNYVSASKDDINSYIFDAVNGEISAKKLTENLFPENEPHIFISHSSKDVGLAIRFANTLYEKYGIISFIDSQLWGHIDFALKEMHERYCKIQGASTYNYNKSNNLLSHMHAILSMALMRVMDNSDSVIFIETENSIHNFMEGKEISPNSNIHNPAETLSPWISSEVNFANKLRENGHKDRETMIKAGMESYSLNKSTRHLAEDNLPKIIHEIDVSGFIEITGNSLRKSLSLPRTYPIHDLDMMYSKFYQG